MDGDGWIEANPAQVARDAPDRIAERMKLAHQSAAYVTGGAGNERADHAERSAYGAAPARTNHVEDCTSPVPDLIGVASKSSVRWPYRDGPF
jgi:hypothetical protein